MFLRATRKYMDDREAYLLNGLVQRHFQVGRILRFRNVRRGCQCRCVEIYTTEQRAFMLLIYPHSYLPTSLDAGGRESNALSEATFPSLRFVAPATGGRGLVVDGPQGTHLMMAQFPPGQAMAAENWSLQDLSQLGLRMAWMHRMMHEQPRPGNRESTGKALSRLLDEPSPRRDALLNLMEARALESFVRASVQLPPLDGWVHGGISAESMLLDDDRQITALMDWGLTGRGSSCEDAVDVFVHWCVDEHGQVRSAEARAFLEAFLSLARPRAPAWDAVVSHWCARQLYYALLGHRQLPRGFGSIVANPHFLSTAIALCHNKSA